MSTWEATGLGSHPGEDHLEAARIVFGEVPGLPYLPELPARGVGADMVGRTAGLLVDLPVEVQPSGWRLSDRPGRDHHRAVDHLRRDLDGLEEVAHDYAGPLKLQVCGPWTLAGSIELKFGDKMLSDPGAVRDLTASLAQGVADHCAEVRRRLPGVTEIVLQLDEPGLPGVLAGTVPTASGFGRLAAVEEWRVEESLRLFPEPVVHCCAPGVPFDLLRRAGVRGVSVDGALLRRRDEEALGELFEAGMTLLLGVVPGRDTRLADAGVVARPAVGLWRRLGFAPDRLAEQVVLTPACGLAGASPAYARAALAACRKAAQVLRDDPAAGMETG
ncbi:cobalamin-independent methionine synthase catalytic subunit [Nonomuraea fuscirosea]|uniref:Cobalamin-independent methionine synthase catalytic subunit n=1 Tax=Nonomuraea fuscirosea TaxID=1291556 RepID=A0A2T0ML53_9ACTN|nr:methionine synthase [Nonomuraea fuscirosea]PRX58410.1 cobalamin-independent methionine synthase catalytic subunit [Nonomuraea fuscirosea]